MKTIGKFSLAFTLFAVSLGLATSRAAAQSIVSGSFKLPVETHWSGAVLPAGDYSYTVEIRGSGPLVAIRNAEGKGEGLFISRDVSEIQESGTQHLTLTRVGETTFVSSFQLGAIGLVLDYSAPKEVSMVAGLPAQRTSSAMLTTAAR